MQGTLSRKVFATVGALLIVAGAFGLSACASPARDTAVRIGTMPTEDFLPMWVAERDAFFADAGVDVELVTFDSAQGLSAAIAAGEVDLAMTDPMRAVSLAESGTDVTMEWVTLGTDAAQGRFGVLGAGKDYALFDALANSKSSGKADAAKPSVGLAANTMPEYVFDKLCEQAGVSVDAFDIQEVASLPDRYSLVASGKLDAAALPGSFLALGEKSGLKVIVDDATGDNISQSVMVARSEFAKDADGARSIERIADAWNRAAEAIGDDPQAHRALLVEKANLNDAVADSYPVSAYPSATAADGELAHPDGRLVEPVIAWMRSKGYVKAQVSYSEVDGSIGIS